MTPRGHRHGQGRHVLHPGRVADGGVGRDRERRDQQGEQDPGRSGDAVASDSTASPRARIRHRGLPDDQESLLAVAERQDPPTIIPAAAPDATGCSPRLGRATSRTRTPPRLRSPKQRVALRGRPTSRTSCGAVALLGLRRGARPLGPDRDQGPDRHRRRPRKVLPAAPSCSWPVGSRRWAGFSPCAGRSCPGRSDPTPMANAILAYALVFGMPSSSCRGCSRARAGWGRTRVDGRSRSSTHSPCR